MNKKQKIVLVITVILLGLMLLFPPFHLLGSAYRQEVNLGYSFIFSPPIYNHTYNQNPLYSIYMTINIGTLSFQYLIIISIGLILFYIFRETPWPKQEKHQKIKNQKGQ